MLTVVQSIYLNWRISLLKVSLPYQDIVQIYKIVCVHKRCFSELCTQTINILINVNRVVFYSRFFCLKMSQEPILTTNDIMSAIGKPHEYASIPLIRFMPKSDEMRVGNISMMENDVNVRITVFMLLLMIDV